MWTALILGFLILIVLLIFIAQNTTTTAFQFLGWHWSLPLGVAILFAAVAGGLITVAVGAVRMVQLRRAAKHNLGRRALTQRHQVFHRVLRQVAVDDRGDTRSCSA